MRQLFLIRHAIAEDRNDFVESGQSDDLRPLTKEGKKKFLKLTKVIQQSEPRLSCILTSPLVRAQQSCELLQGVYPGTEILTSPLIRPESEPQQCLALLEELKGDRIAILGHEPHLSALASLLLSGHKNSFIKFKKAAWLKIDFAFEMKPGKGTLAWYLPPGPVL